MPVDLSNLYGGYASASRYNRVERRTLQRALNPYKLAFTASRGKTDAQIRRMATSAVIARHRNRTTMSSMN